MDSKALTHLAYDLGLEPAHLDEAVHEAASKLASAANNDGMESQLQFLVEQYGEEATEKLLRAEAA